MKKVVGRRAFLLAVALAFAGAATAAYSDDSEEEDDDDHDRARRALEEGRTRPLAEILAVVEEEIGGDVIGVEFERRGGAYVYELKIVDASGRLREVVVDATTAEIVATERD